MAQPLGEASGEPNDDRGLQPQPAAFGVRGQAIGLRVECIDAGEQGVAGRLLGFGAFAAAKLFSVSTSGVFWTLPLMTRAASPG